jgi:D-glycero-D-manno-heptose 1,7-bisphosphate phosphatase
MEAAMSMMPKPETRSARALFLDRDGVVNVENNYLYRIADARFMPGIFDLCRTAQSLGYRLIIVTNQGGIGRGIHTELEYFELMEWMRAQFAVEGIIFDAIYHCPYHPTAELPEYRRDTIDRKPAPGMILRGAAEFSLDLAASVMVGDRCTDIAAAQAAGVGKAFLIAGTEPALCEDSFDYETVETLEAVRAWLISSEAAG